MECINFKGEQILFQKIVLWMKTICFLNEIKNPLGGNCTNGAVCFKMNVRSALHFSYSIAIVIKIGYDISSIGLYDFQ